jgi:hypothetical protein
MMTPFIAHISPTARFSSPPIHDEQQQFNPIDATQSEIQVMRNSMDC